jgi:hypothetical protein
VIQLPASVIGDVNALDAFIAGQGRVFAGANALEDQPDAELVTDSLHVVPIERRLKLHSDRTAATAAPSPRLAETLGDVALAPAVDRAVDGYAEGVITEVHRLAHLLVDPVGLAACIELEDLRSTGSVADRLHPGLGHRAEDERNTERRSSMRRRQTSFTRQGFKAADRSEDDWEAHGLAEKAVGGVDLGDIAQNARPQREPVQCLAVAEQRRFRRRTSNQVVPDVAVELLVCGAHQLV